MVHEPDTLDLIMSRGGGGTVIHAGAFFGDFLPALLGAGLHVRAFEPSRSNWLHAKATLEANGLSTDVLTNAALGEAPYDASLVTTEEVGSVVYRLGGGSYISRQYTGPMLSERCQVLTIDSVVGMSEQITVIHLDVERYERKAIAGARSTIQRSRPLLILETPLGWRAMRWLASLGYRRADYVHHNTVLDATVAVAKHYR